MKRSLVFLVTASLINSTALSSHAEQIPFTNQAYAQSPLQSSMVLRGIGKCARNRQCRKQVVERIDRFAKRILELTTDLAMSGAEDLHEMLGQLIRAPDNKEVLARLDKLEALLAKKNVHCPELKRELEAIRTIYR